MPRFLFEEVLSTRKSRSYTPGKIIRGLMGPIPLTVLNYSSPDVAQRLKLLFAERQFDAVHLVSSHLFNYLDEIRSVPGCPAVLLDWHNIESELMLRFASETTNLPKKLIGRRTAELLRRVELKLLERCDAHTVVSEREKSELLQKHPKAQIHVIPNGVDTEDFSPPPNASPRTSLLFVGSMDYHANIDAVTWFGQDIWPTISHRFEDLDFTVAGRSPSREVQNLASERLHVTGTVDDVRPFYSRAIAVVVPLRVGGGTRLKIFEAMAMGVPVVSTTLGAEGIAVTNGVDVLLADSKQEMIAAVERLVQDPVLREKLATGGRRLVTEEYDWTSIGNRLYHIYVGLVNGGGRH